MMLKEPDKKFSGDIGEYWIEYVDAYQQMARDYNLSQALKH